MNEEEKKIIIDEAYYDNLISEIKKKREAMKREREYSFGSFFPVAMKVAATTIGTDFVSVQPMSTPSFLSSFYFNTSNSTIVTETGDVS